MKLILYIITQSELGGAQRYIIDLAKNLKLDYKIGIIAGGQKENNAFAKTLAENHISFHNIPTLMRSISPLKDIITTYKLIKIIKKIEPDIIHLNSSKISILGSLASKLAQIGKNSKKFKTIYTAHGWVFNEPLSKFKINFYKHAEILTSTYKNTIICINKFDLNVAKQTLNLNQNKLRLIHNGIEAQEHTYLPKEIARKKLISKLKTKIDIRKNTILIGSIGNLYKTKDYLTFIRAFKITKTALQIQVSNKIHIKAIIIGEGTERNKLESLIAKENLTDDIYLAGSIFNAQSLLKAFDIYICSSIKEGLPYSILEAGLATLPIVATNTGGIPDIIKDSTNSLLTNTNDPEKFAMQLTKLIQNYELRVLYGKNIHDYIKHNFKLNDMIIQTKKVYEN